ncbi:MAG: hypothetical protein ACMXX8_00290 [Candidatus Woesearchaeota archaeon]
MVTMTLAIPSELRSRMDTFPEINWSEIARQAFEQRIRDMEFLKEFKKQSTLTEADALRMGKELNKKLLKRHK